MYSRALLALVVVVAGCAAPVAKPDAASDDWTWPDDPPTDRLGWESGYWHNESIDVDQSDGLTDAELDAYVARTMARVEHVRRLEFESRVPVEVISREAYRNRSVFDASDGPRAEWNEQVWEGLFLVGEDRPVGAAFDDIYGSAVQGYYSPDESRIVIVSDGSTPVIDRATLAHELVHALQDQRFGLGGGAVTQDARLAHDGVVEGDARYVERVYERRCGETWDCVDSPAGGEAGGLGDSVGVFLVVYQPYSDGPHLVDTVRQRGGWAAVNDLYARPPASTEQVIHPDAYPDDVPLAVPVPERSGERWSRYDVDPQAETVGEASIYAMLWARGAIPRGHLDDDVAPFSTYSYAHPATTGWAGDSLVPYRGPGGEDGYVFRTVWDTEVDAREFEAAYRAALVDGLDAHRRGDGVYVVADGPYADAFRVTRHGTYVTVVNAPTVADLDGVHAA